ncbi:NUDIX domain-containing protein [Clostridiaceae bacterium M8S5]|nr:NUDIX domain-containing protein [Clostridiaceae bacterium M8S5]
MDVVVKGIIVYKGKMLIVKRTAYKERGANQWECVGGKMEEREDLETALLREIYEEAGLEVRIGRLLYATIFKKEQEKQALILTYLCFAKDDKVELSHEHSQYLWIRKNEITNYLTGDILRDFEHNNIFNLEELV